jgi:hypothetical protein
VLLNNNPPLIAHLGQQYILDGMVLNITPLLLDKFDTHFWQGEAPVFESLLSRFDPQTQELYRQTGPQETYLLALIAERIIQAGGSVGMDGELAAPPRQEHNTQVPDAGNGPISGQAEAHLGGLSNAAALRFDGRPSPTVHSFRTRGSVAYSATSVNCAHVCQKA